MVGCNTTNLLFSVITGLWAYTPGGQDQSNVDNGEILIMKGNYNASNVQGSYSDSGKDH